MYKWDCPICDSKNLGEFPTHDVCQICGWEDDPIQRNDPSYIGGANDLSLIGFKKQWQKENHPMPAR